MAMYAAAVLANNRHRRRAENVERTACQSEEKCESYLRLTEPQISLLSRERIQWRTQVEGFETKLLFETLVSNQTLI